MSLSLLRNMLHQNMRPTRVADQHFGMALTPDDLMSPMTLAPFHNDMSALRHYLRNWQLQNNDHGSTMHLDKDKFQVSLDVQQFAPGEITVKAVDNCLVIEGRHEEKEDEHGYISRHFKRRYIVPKEYHMDHVESYLSSDGVLTITAPMVEAIEGKPAEKVLPIANTGVPHKTIKSHAKA